MKTIREVGSQLHRYINVVHKGDLTLADARALVKEIYKAGFDHAMYKFRDGVRLKDDTKP
jgi:hypothetical protein